MPSDIDTLDPSIVQDLLDFDPETGIFRWRKKCGARALAGQQTGTKDPKGYVLIKINGRHYRAHRLAWVITYNLWPAQQIDHINGDRADNRLCNLREASNMENCQNRGVKTGTATGIRGVHWHKLHRKYYVSVCVNGRQHFVGLYRDLKEATAARNEAASRLHGEFFLPA